MQRCEGEMLADEGDVKKGERCIWSGSFMRDVCTYMLFL